MKRMLVLGCLACLSLTALADPADACHHRRGKRRGGGCHSAAPVYYNDGYKGGYQDGSDGSVPAPPPPPAPPAPRPA